ncbi:MAG: hypothetical protein GXO78_00410 [Calditrichaeota bacterium]|nr:hypothetical protein [Calditrichota bacterium]
MGASFSNRFKRLFLLLWVMWAGSIGSLPAHPAVSSVRSPNPPDNETAIARLISRPILTILRQHVSPSIPLLVEVTDTSSEVLQHWIRQVIEDSSLKNNFIVYKKPGEHLNLYFSLRVTRPVVRVTYRLKGRKWVFFTRKVERTVRVGFHVQLISPEQQIVYSQRLEQQYRDEIPGNAFKNLENPLLPFTSGTKESSTFINKIVEPVLISGATITVVYLFYILRSGKK